MTIDDVAATTKTLPDFADDWPTLVAGAEYADAVPVLRILGAPLTCLTLGLFSLVINGAALIIVEWTLNSLDLGIGHLVIDSWGAAIIGAIVLRTEDPTMDWSGRARVLLSPCGDPAFRI